MGTFAAALIALLMLSYASVQATVMQAAMAGAVPPSDGATWDHLGMAAMAEMAAKSICGGVAKPAHPPIKACSYCAAAAHPPLMGAATPWRTPLVLTFAAFRVVATHGPRGPPVPQPRARGPPVDPLTL